MKIIRIVISAIILSNTKTVKRRTATAGRCVTNGAARAGRGTRLKRIQKR